MHCENCGLRVETEITRTADVEQAQRFRKWFDDDDVEGEYLLDEVGSMVEKLNGDGSSTEWQVELRVDTCVNCAVPIRARTYLGHWDVEEDDEN